MALLEIAEKRNQADEVGGELTAIVDDLFVREPKVEQLLTSPAIRRGKREPIIDTAFRGRVSDLVYDFLRLLNHGSRMGLLRSIAAAYADLQDDKAQRVRVLVRTAVPLSEGQMAGLKKSLQSSMKREPTLVSRVEPALLGGMILRVGDQVFDNSIRTKIDTLRNQLLAGSN